MSLPLHRPTPIRPFRANRLLTPPADDSQPSEKTFLQAGDGAGTDGTSERHTSERASEDPTSPSASATNLTSSALSGIYSPLSPPWDPSPYNFYDSDYGGNTGGVFDRWSVTPPWTTDADQEHLDAVARDERLPEIVRARARKGSMRQPADPPSQLPPPPLPPPRSAGRTLPLVLRAGFLFALGVGYGVLVTQAHDGRGTAAVERLNSTGLTSWLRYLVFWGPVGVLLGVLLPWFDALWEKKFGENKPSQPGSAGTQNKMAQYLTQPDPDWALVVRGIGAFVGIVFAIRRLPWASATQIALTLALTNLFLWYIVDRSWPGFVLSAAAGLSGCAAVLLGILPDHAMMPAPAATSDELNMKAQVVWTLSVWFCGSVCLGNIGRRLALNQQSADKGRWRDAK